MQEWLEAPETLIIRGGGEALSEWQHQVGGDYHPARQVFAIPDNADLPAALADKIPDPSGPVAYRCVGTQCLPPIRDPADL